MDLRVSRRELDPAMIVVLLTVGYLHKGYPPPGIRTHAGRPLHGEPPKMRPGIDPSAVAERLVRAIELDERDVPASSFTP